MRKGKKKEILIKNINIENNNTKLIL